MIDTNTAWQAVLERDRRFDGKFVFAVRSTGVYCRPSCPARRPRQTNVRFYDDPNLAEQEGFRACRRCKPRGDAPAAAMARRARTILDEVASKTESITLDALARRLGISPHHLQRVFKREVGASPKEYLAAQRNNRLRRELKEGRSVTDAIYESGFGSSSRAYEQPLLGMSPGRYRAGGEGVNIRYTIAQTSVGPALVAATERGLCAVSLGEHVERELREEFPKATLERADGDDSLATLVRDVVARIDGETPARELPLDLRATSFQLRVWNALRKIPHGETRTYSEIAAAIGAPTAGRAVAGACARNRLAVVIPCHRVVRADGNAGGYRWGEDRKKKLLGKELAVASASEE
jgi:AraC family transcriptional regulator of adaptative response/methylated-DNA-[protein]-cysteine methyltransferase